VQLTCLKLNCRKKKPIPKGLRLPPDDSPCTTAYRNNHFLFSKPCETPECIVLAKCEF